MKGRHYKPCRKPSLSQNQKKPRPKPWNEVPKIPSIYFWKSSLPEKCKSDKSRIFRHVSETKRTKNTEEFLKKNQKYIEIIADSHRHTPSMRASLLNSRESSSDDLEKGENQRFLIPPKQGKDAPDSPQNEFRVVERINFSSSKAGKHFDLPGDSKRLLVRRASLPRLFENIDKKVQNLLKSPSVLSLNTVRDSTSSSMINPRIKYSLNLLDRKKRGSVC